MISLSLLSLFSLISSFLGISFWSFLNGFQINGPSSTLSKSLYCFLINIFSFVFSFSFCLVKSYFYVYFLFLSFSIYLIKRAISTPLRWAVFFLFIFLMVFVMVVKSWRETKFNRIRRQDADMFCHQTKWVAQQWS